MVDPTRPDYSNSPASLVRAAFGYAPADVSEPPAVTFVTPFDRARRSFEETAGCIRRQSFQLRGFLEKERLTHRVRIYGAVAHDRLKDLFAASDIVFLPAHGAGIGLAPYQAMASGVALVGVAEGGWPELITPEWGVLIERGTPEGQAEAYASAIASLIRQPVRMRALGRAGRERVERYFRIEQMHQNMLTMLLEAMRRHRTWPGAVPTPEAARESARQSVDHVYRAREEEVRRGKTGPPASVGGRMRRALSRWVQALLARDVTQEPELSPTSTRA